MRSKQDPWWFQDIVGFEDEEDEEEESEEEEEDESEEEEESEDDSEEEEESEEDEEEEPPKKKSTAGLKSALRRERLKNRRLEKQLKALQPAKKAPAKKAAPKKGEEEEEQEPPKADAKSERLAAKLKEQAIDTVILRFGSDFRNTSDLLRLIDRSEIEADQDEEDPSEIEVDDDSVEEAVKALAKKSPYLLKTKEERLRSGSKFGGRKKKSDVPSEEALKAKYPALRH